MSMSETLPTSSVAESPQAFQYKAMSSGAVAAALLGVLSLLTLAASRESLQSCLLMSPIPLVGILVGWSALRRIRELPDQLGGKRLAAGGALFSLLCLITGVSYSSYVYATEVPEGYTRISFVAMRPDEVQQRSGTIVPDEIAQLDGQKVFIKGYIRPDSTRFRRNIRKFQLVRDNASCCYGDLSKVKHYDMMLVETVGSVSTDFSYGLFRVGGTLRVNAENLRRGLGQPVFSLEADYIR